MGLSAGAFGQNPAKMSYVLRPSSRSLGRARVPTIRMTAPPDFSSEYSIVHPPRSNPPLGSSVAPPGACMTPSNDTNGLAMIRLTCVSWLERSNSAVPEVMLRSFRKVGSPDGPTRLLRRGGPPPPIQVGGVLRQLPPHHHRRRVGAGNGSVQGPQAGRPMSPVDGSDEHRTGDPQRIASVGVRAGRRVAVEKLLESKRGVVCLVPTELWNQLVIRPPL